MAIGDLVINAGREWMVHTETPDRVGLIRRNDQGNTTVTTTTPDRVRTTARAGNSVAAHFARQVDAALPSGLGPSRYDAALSANGIAQIRSTTGAPTNDPARVAAGIARATRPRNAAPTSGSGTGNS